MHFKQWVIESVEYCRKARENVARGTAVRHGKKRFSEVSGLEARSQRLRREEILRNGTKNYQLIVHDDFQNKV